MPIRSSKGKTAVTIYIADKQAKYLKKQSNMSAYVESLIAQDMQIPTIEDRLSKLEQTVDNLCLRLHVRYR